MTKRTGRTLLRQQLTSPFHRKISLLAERVAFLEHNLEMPSHGAEVKAKIREELVKTQVSLLEANRMIKLQRKFSFSLLPAADQEEVALRRANNHPVTQEEIDLVIASASPQD